MRQWLLLFPLFGAAFLLAGCQTNGASAPTAGSNLASPVAAATSTTDISPTPPPVIARTSTPESTPPTETAAPNSTPEMEISTSDSTTLAAVRAVQVSGADSAYTFEVTVESPDTGCEQYADWWEVVSLEGELLYRRVLLHSHVNEQPFTRTGGPVPVAADQIVWVRAHMQPGGYGGQAWRGSVQDGFEPADLAPNFAASLANQAPQPTSCAF